MEAIIISATSKKAFLFGFDLLKHTKEQKLIFVDVEFYKEFKENKFMEIGEKEVILS